MTRREFRETGGTDGDRLADIDLIVNDEIESVMAAMRGAIGRGDLASVCELAIELKDCADAVMRRCGQG